MGEVFEKLKEKKANGHGNGCDILLTGTLAVSYGFPRINGEGPWERDNVVATSGWVE